MRSRSSAAVLLAGFFAGIVVTPSAGYAVTLTFSGATATFHQTLDRDWSPSEMIDGITGPQNGWAIDQFNGLGGDQTFSETALLTLASPVAAGHKTFTFTIYQNNTNGHELGDFSLGFTTAATPTLTSTEVAFNITGALSAGGATFSSPAVGQLLVGGALPSDDTYTITATENAGSPITGIFLNAINDPANGLPTGGPGRQPSNGNFVVSEFVAAASAVPEPATWALMLIGVSGLGGMLRRRRAIFA